MRRRNSQIKLQSISEILLKLLKRRGLAGKIEEKAFFQLWPQAVGPQIALQTKPDAFRAGTLFVKTTSHVWLHELSFMKEDIRRQLNTLTGKEVVKEIRFSIGHTIAASGEPADAPGAMSPRKLLKERDKKMIAECTAQLADQELAAILKRVMQVEISRRRSRQAKQGR